MTIARKPRFRRPPRVGDRVTIHLRRSHREYPNGTVAEVIEVLDGCCGPILALRIPGCSGTVDLFWRKVRAMNG